MSKLATAIQAVRVMERTWLPPTIMLSIDIPWVQPNSNVGTLFKVSAEFSVEIVIPDHAKPGHKVDAFQAAKRQILEQVFGEFRADLLALQHDAYLLGSYEMAQKLGNLERKMLYPDLQEK